MRRWKFRGETGSAILEFIAFVLVGQLLVFGSSVAISQNLVSRVELQSLAIVVARSTAKGVDFPLPEGVVLKATDCSPRLICIELTRDQITVPAVSIR